MVEVLERSHEKRRGDWPRSERGVFEGSKGPQGRLLEECGQRGRAAQSLHWLLSVTVSCFKILRKQLCAQGGSACWKRFEQEDRSEQGVSQVRR